MMRSLIVITARGGSKGLSGKNIKLLRGKPLICYSIDAARKVADDKFICVSTDSEKIIKVVENYGLKVPFKRPKKLATDKAGSNEVLLHALDFYEKKGNKFDAVVLLQPTSPFRTGEHLKEALKLFTSTIDMVVSVKETKANPYFVLFEESEEGFLFKCKKNANFTRRQDVPKIFQFNGAVYIINVNSLKKYSSFNEFGKRKKYLMDELHSIDIDSQIDFEFAEFLIQKRYIKLEMTIRKDT